jgi:DNA-binding response OmpR family regulator
MRRKKEMKKYKILLLEDNPIHREVIYDGLEDFGYEVKKAQDVVGAKKILNEEKFIPDLFLLDIVIGSIKNQGIQFAEELKNQKEFKNIPVLYISAHLDENGIAERFPDDAAANVLPKPFDFDQLINKIRKMLRG